VSASATGTLTVSLSQTADALQPRVSVIDSETLQLVATSRCDEPVEVPAGTYVVTATLPTGQRTLGVVDVAAGAARAFDLPAPQPAAAAAPGLRPPPRLRVGVTRGRPASAWYVRFFERHPGEGYAPAEPDAQVEDARLPALGTALRVSPRGGGVLFAQLAVPGAVPLNVALPVNGMTSVQSCRLTVTVTSGVVSADMSLPDNPRVDAVARYLLTGNLRDAVDVLGDAELLLAQKMADPFAAALGGYALVRQRRLDLLHHWPRNLSGMFPWLADGAIIAGEEAALEGDHATAVRELCDGARRGLPVFADGCSILMSRLREYATAPEPAPGVSADAHREAADRLEGLLPLGPFVDFARIALAFRAADPADAAGSQTPFDPRPGERWRRFDPRAPSGLAEVG
jgi:hypothetical protein